MKTKRVRTTDSLANKSVPKFIQGSKYIATAKKAERFDDGTGKITSFEELMAASKETHGKGGKKL